MPGGALANCLPRKNWTLRQERRGCGRSGGKEGKVQHIGKVLGSLGRGKAIPGLKIFEPEPAGLTAEEKREELRKSLRVSSLANTFDNFEPVAGTEAALAAFEALALGKTEWQMLLCYGGVGNGKTHLCEATAIALYKRGLFCRVLTMARIMRALKECMNPGSLTAYDELIERYCRCERLIVDDVGMGGSGSEWEWGQLEEIMAARYRERLFTILTTNRDLTELPERIPSRFLDPDIGRVVLNGSGDYRRLKGNNKGGEHTELA